MGLPYDATRGASVTQVWPATSCARRWMAGARPAAVGGRRWGGPVATPAGSGPRGLAWAAAGVRAAVVAVAVASAVAVAAVAAAAGGTTGAAWVTVNARHWAGTPALDDKKNREGRTSTAA